MCIEIINNNLHSELVFSQKAMMCVYVVPKGYPNSSEFGFDLYFNDNLDKNKIIFGSVDKINNHYLTKSSRTLLLTETCSTLKNCFSKIYNNINYIYGNIYYRDDIGSKFLTNYEMCGVSIENGNKAVKSIKTLITKTYNKNITSNYGSFGGELNFENNILVASIDGVGTKSILAEKYYGKEAYINLGKDLVNHSINDILVQGAYPLFFLDYFGCNCLDETILYNFIKGVSEICVNENIVLLGGETAELGSIYTSNNNDCVGCIVGYKDTNYFKNIIQKGDIILGFDSHSPHTNGYSLIRKILSDCEKNNIIVPQDIIDALLIPHKTYINEIKYIVENYGYDVIHNMAHITGGGLVENIKRVTQYDINIDYNIIKTNMPLWCTFLMEKGKVDFEEMLNVFNCGVGYVIIVSKENSNKLLNDKKIKLRQIGYI